MSKPILQPGESQQLNEHSITVENAGLFDRYIELKDRCEELYQEMVAACIPKEYARYMLAKGAISEIVCSANISKWKHLFRSDLILGLTEK